MDEKDFEDVFTSSKYDEQEYIIEKADPKDIKDVMYHVSNPYYRNKISKEGLVPSIGDSYKLHWDEIVSEDDMVPLIFLDKDNNYDSTYDDDRYIVHTENLDKNKFIYDPDRRGGNNWICYTDVIPPENLDLIHKGTGDSL